MLEFEVKDMMCDHCVSSITKALRKVDATSQVEFDMLARRVRVAGALDAQSAGLAIKAAGYSPVVVQSG
ncbi:MAG: heavy-metal-associated domain-containing protein [Burkholderiales bacterium]|nr:MAG: heavy-metal-associated domain-containing protein [Burkholderiales bacterium]